MEFVISNAAEFAFYKRVKRRNWNARVDFPLQKDRTLMVVTEITKGQRSLDLKYFIANFTSNNLFSQK